MATATLPAAVQALLKRHPPAPRPPGHQARERDSSCTGIAASWCPLCGTCTCVHEDDEVDGRPAAELAVEREGYLPIVEIIAGKPFRCAQWCVIESKLTWRGVTMDFNGTLCKWIDPACPLHGDDSKHADGHFVEVAAELEADGVRVSYEDFRRKLAFWED